MTTPIKVVLIVAGVCAAGAIFIHPLPKVSRSA